MNTILILEELAELTHSNPSVDAKVTMLKDVGGFQKTLSSQSYFATEDKVVCIE